jgi:RDD family
MDSEPMIDRAVTANDPQNTEAWRSELSAKIDRYRARHRPKPPRYPSLNLKFDPVSTSSAADFSTAPQQDPATPPSSGAVNDVESPPVNEFGSAPDVLSPAVSGAGSLRQPVPSPVPAARKSAAKIAGKLIEFPLFAPRVPSPDELAEPVIDRPRILEVPDIEPPAPALGGITIEQVQIKEVEKRPGIELPLQSAPLARRIAAAAIDGLIIGLASALFAFIFWKIAAVPPPRAQLLGLAAALPIAIWAGYEYLLLVYAGSTPGLQLAGLQLTGFDGTLTSRTVRMWRVFAFYLSAISLGMGYAWVFLDEDSLCWHDRITRTYLAPKASH